MRGRDVKRYNYEFANLWLIVSHNGVKQAGIPRIEIENYPAIKAHLDQYYEQLEKRSDKGDTPYNLRNCVYMDDFSKQKIVYREISNAMDACLVEPNIMLNNKCYLITGEHLAYLLSFFNSKLFTKIILPQVNTTGGKGEQFLQAISAVLPSPTVEEELEKLLRLRNEINTSEIDNTVDKIFCDIYNLSLEEQEYIMN